MTHREKLVRDGIPAIAPERTYRIAAPEEMPRLLLDKMREEAAELLATEPGSPEEMEEAVDLKHVASILAEYHGGYAMQSAVKIRERGGFLKRVVMRLHDREAS